MKTSQNLIEKAIEFGENLLKQEGMQTEGFQEYWYQSWVAEWERGDIHRLYVNLKYGRYHKGNKWKRGVVYYIDLNTGHIEESGNNYCNANERHTIASITQQISNLLFSKAA